MKILLKHRRTFVLAMIDACTILMSLAISYILLKFLMSANSQFPYIEFNLKRTVIHCALLTSMSVLGLYLCGAYKSLWRYASIKDLVVCLAGMVLGLIMYYIVIAASKFIYSDIHTILTEAIATIGVFMVRICYNLLYTRTHREASGALKKRTLIVGGGDACSRIIMEMRSVDSAYTPIVIVDDDIQKQGRQMHGITVGGSTDDIPQLVQRFNIHTIFVAIPSLDGERKKRIINICSETVCEVKVIPYIHKILNDSNLIGQAQNINIEDLLGRDVVKFDDTNVRDMVCGKVCMVTGGGGSIGSELCRQIAEFNPGKLIIVDIYENNAYDIQQELLTNYKNLDLEVRIASVRDYDKIKLLFEMFRPELVYHAAAHKHVPLMETSPEEAIKNNIFGTLNVASLASEYGVKKFVLVSTDKAVNPTNVMGATKRACEMIVQYFAQKSKFTEFVAVRFGNVLGSNGSVIPLFEKQIASGGPLTVTHPDIIRYFMTIPEAVSLILQAGTIAKGGEIFVLDMGEPVKILSLAENLIRLHGKEPYKEIDIKFTGLRPGEKLFEELLMSEEGLKETQNKKIFIGTQIEIDEEEFPKSLNVIRELADKNDSDAVVEELRKLVPTFNHVVLNR
ncbi:MAG: polysaccharide biosynthesis protein [Ruminococcaceae bacterium]|nr:polysaccharide biosynthesis protein [Oscillospiraceae bacterium]